MATERKIPMNCGDANERDDGFGAGVVGFFGCTSTFLPGGAFGMGFTVCGLKAKCDD